VIGGPAEARLAIVIGDDLPCPQIHKELLDGSTAEKLSIGRV